jgi:hypothetical protein
MGIEILVRKLRHITRDSTKSGAIPIILLFFVDHLLSARQPKADTTTDAMILSLSHTPPSPIPILFLHREAFLPIPIS